MFKVKNCIVAAHDLKLVALAAVICALASYAAINLLRHARKSSGQMRGVWLAFTPGIPSGYNVILTMLSLIAAILLSTAGLAVSLIPNWREGPWLGGAHRCRRRCRHALYRNGCV